MKPEIAIIRKLGDLPPMDTFAWGCFAKGWIPELMDPIEFFNPDNFHAGAVAGNLRRYGGRNQQIFDYFRGSGKDCFVVETGRLADRALVGATWFLYLNQVPFIPNRQCPSDRREKLGMKVEFKPRGEKILIVGQAPEFDKDMNRCIVPTLMRSTTREVCYRPRKGQGEFVRGVDSYSRTGPIDKDLDEAWCVVTHSSNVGGEALMRGIPVVCDPCATYASLCTSDVTLVDSLKPPDPDAVEDYLNRLAYVNYTTEELGTGDGFAWLLDNYGGGA